MRACPSTRTRRGETAPLRSVHAQPGRARRAARWHGPHPRAPGLKSPGTGLPPQRLHDVLGRRLTRPVEAITPRRRGHRRTAALGSAKDIPQVLPADASSHGASQLFEIRTALTAIRNHPASSCRVVVAASALLDPVRQRGRAIERDGFHIDERVYMVLGRENLVTSAKSTASGCRSWTRCSTTQAGRRGDRGRSLRNAGDGGSPAYMNIPSSTSRAARLPGRWTRSPSRGDQAVELHWCRRRWRVSG